MLDSRPWRGKYTLGLRRSRRSGGMVGLLSRAPNRTCRAIANDLCHVTATYGCKRTVLNLSNHGAQLIPFYDLPRIS